MTLFTHTLAEQHWTNRGLTKSRSLRSNCKLRLKVQINYGPDYSLDRRAVHHAAGVAFILFIYLILLPDRKGRDFFFSLHIPHASQSYILPVGVGYLEHNTLSMFHFKTQTSKSSLEWKSQALGVFQGSPLSVRRQSKIYSILHFDLMSGLRAPCQCYTCLTTALE